MYVCAGLYSATLNGQFNKSTNSNTSTIDNQKQIVYNEFIRLTNDNTTISSELQTEIQEHILELLTSYNIEIVPVAAVIGGMIGQEIVKLISNKDEPITNYFIYDAMNGQGGRVFTL